MSNKCSEVKSTIFPSKLFWSINIIIKLSTSNSHLFSTCKCTWYRCDYFLAILSLCHESGQITDASPTNLHGPYDFITEWHVQAWLGVQGFHSMQQVQNWSRCGDMRAGTQNWWNKSKGKKKKVLRHDKITSSIISQFEHINRREHTLCHALVSVNRHASGAPFSFSLSLLPCKHRLFLIFQFLGLHDNKIIPCRKHWSGSEGNTKGSAHKASQCSQCTLLRRQATSS